MHVQRPQGRLYVDLLSALPPPSPPFLPSCTRARLVCAAPSRHSTVAVRATFQDDRSSRPRGRGRFSRRWVQQSSPCGLLLCYEPTRHGNLVDDSQPALHLPSSPRLVGLYHAVGQQAHASRQLALSRLNRQIQQENTVCDELISGCSGFFLLVSLAGGVVVLLAVQQQQQQVQ